MLGDFNVHDDCKTDPETTDLQSLFDCFDLVQHVDGATHKYGHTLDLVVSRTSDNMVQSCEVGSFVGDHNTIYITMNWCKPHLIRKEISFRKIRSINADSFAKDIESSNMARSLPDDVDEIVSCYSRVLQELLEKHALGTHPCHCPTNNAALDGRNHNGSKEDSTQSRSTL